MGLGNMQGEDRRDRRQIHKIESVRPSTSLTSALGLLLETGASSLPVTDEVLSYCTLSSCTLPCPAVQYCGCCLHSTDDAWWYCTIAASIPVCNVALLLELMHCTVACMSLTG